VLQPGDGNAASVIVDGVEQSNLADNAITLLDDHQEHSVEVRILTRRQSSGK
jgi:hypothetical protein